MGLVDDRAVEFRGQLLVHAVPVVHPDLHDVDLSGSKLLHILSGFRNGGHPVGSFRSAGFGHREASPRGAEPRCVWNRLCSYLKSHIARVLAQAHGGAHSVERLALQLVDEHRPVGRQVSVRVDDRGHDRLAAQIHTTRAGRNLHLPGSANLRETCALDNEGGVIDRRAPIADNEPCPFENCHACLGLSYNSLSRDA
ncbi:MAG: hypothetical protein DMG11_11285 [Acidobacteria bacterium]|nr:MAG: hypothetical protein DMG11_11285 [Acidobacteriota bacterium]